MLTVITGGSKSGKSSLGEKILSSFQGEKYYIATMMPYDEEDGKIIMRHRKMREGKGFITIEQYRDIDAAPAPFGCAALLECVGNLCANEMFADGSSVKNPAEKIAEGIIRLGGRLSELTVITNSVAFDGVSYTPETLGYIKAMGGITKSLSLAADCVIETVYSIPLILKGECPKCL